MSPLTDYLGVVVTPSGGQPALGDLPMRGQSGGWTTLPAGAANQVLTMDPTSGQPVWKTPVSYVTSFTLTAVKTANYTAAAFEWVRFDTSGGARTLTLPQAPADKTRIGTSLVTAGNALNLAAGTGDTIQNAPTLQQVGQAAILQYDAASKIWIVQSYVPTLPSISGLPKPTSVKTANYTASPADFVLVDATSGSRTITLPTAPADQTLAGVKIVAWSAGNTVTVQAGGTDRFNVAGGSTSLVLDSKFESLVFQYQASTGLWIAQLSDPALGQADGAAKLGSDGFLGGPGGSTQSPTTAMAMPKPQLLETHSHSLFDGGSYPSDWSGWHEHLYAMFGAAKRNIRAVGGAIAAWYEQGSGGNNVPNLGSGGFAKVLQRQTRPTSSMPNGSYLPANTLFLCHYGGNDLARLGGLTPTPWITAMRTMMSRGIACSIDEAESSSMWTFPSGTWATSPNPTVNQNSGVGTRYISAGASGTAVYTTASDLPAGRVVAIGLYIPGTADTCTVTITVNGVTRFTLNLNSATLTDRNTPVWIAGTLPIIHTIRIGTGVTGDPALPAGSNVIQVAFSSITGGGWGVDFGQVESDPLDGPILLIPNLNRFASYSLYAGNLSFWAHGPDAATDPLNDTSVARYNTALNALLTEFAGRPLVYTDVDALLNANPNYFASDGAHLSDKGHALLAQQVYQDTIKSGLLTPRIAAAASLQGNTEWTPLPLNNSWAPYNAFGFDPLVAYRRDESGNVFVKGAVKNGTSAGAVIATLPIGCRPKAGRAFPIATASGISYVTVAANGTIQNTGPAGSTVFTSLDGINFPAEA